MCPQQPHGAGSQTGPGGLRGDPRVQQHNRDGRGTGCSRLHLDPPVRHVQVQEQGRGLYQVDGDAEPHQQLAQSNGTLLKEKPPARRAATRNRKQGQGVLRVGATPLAPRRAAEPGSPPLPTGAACTWQPEHSAGVRTGPRRRGCVDRDSGGENHSWTEHQDAPNREGASHGFFDTVAARRQKVLLALLCQPAHFCTLERAGGSRPPPPPPCPAPNFSQTWSFLLLRTLPKVEDFMFYLFHNSKWVCTKLDCNNVFFLFVCLIM